jgi:hypothetical protein
MGDSLDRAKDVLERNEQVLYGIFGVIASSGFFPPRDFLNEFLLWGSDPCDQDGRMTPWIPFSLSVEAYDEIRNWWVANHPGTIEDSLGAATWNDWVCELLDPEIPRNDSSP